MISLRRNLWIFGGAVVLLLVWGMLAEPAASAPDIESSGLAPVEAVDPLDDPNWEWAEDVVDPSKQFGPLTDRSLALDSAGRAHVAYGQDHLYYAAYDNGLWRFHVVDWGEGVGQYAALALDGDNLPHISYYDETHGDLRYAHYDSTQWFTATIDSTGAVGQYTSIALDGNGHPHISYYDAGNSGLKYASFDGTSWATQTVDDLGVMGRYTSLALDDTGQPHIAYYGTPNLKYARLNGATWVIQIVDPTNLVGRFASLALDEAGQPAISYYDETNHDLKFATWDGTAWQVETVDAGEIGDANGGLTSLAFDATGHPYIAYFAPDNVKLAYFDGADWQFETLPDPGAGVSALSLALNVGDDPTVAVIRQPLLRVLSFDGAEWKNRLVDYAGDTGYESSLVIDENDGLHFSYRSGDYLKYLAFNGQEWRMALVDTGGRSSSLALDSAGYPRISYQTEDTLKYAYYDGLGWQVETLEVVGPTYNEYNVMPTSLGLGPDDLPHISYCHGTLGYCETLHYAHFNGSTWITTTLSTGGAGNSLAVDAAGLPHIAFADSYLKYAFFDGGVWTISSIDPLYSHGMALALSDSGLPRIIYHRADNQVNYAVFDGAAWNLEIAFSGYRTESLRSLALDSQGFPHFSQCAWNYHSWVILEYIHKNADGWQPVILREGYIESDLDVDSRDWAHISYSNAELVHHYQAPVALDSVTIQGLTHVALHTEATYRATTAPLNAYQPITITWSNGTTGSAAVYEWEQPGTYMVTASARNAANVVTGILAVQVGYQTYLPIVIGPPELTTMYGLVRNSDDYSQIPGAMICVLAMAPGNCATADESGSYWLDNVPVGDRIVEVSADGYHTMSAIYTIQRQNNWIDFYLIPLVRKGRVAGQVVSAVTAQGIDGASVCVASGSPCTTTGGDGLYTLIDVPVGTQTIRASASGYFSQDQESTVAVGETATANFVLSPALPEGSMRIVLTWGTDPADLDSHLWLPLSQEEEIYFNHRGNCSADPYACLDVDDVNSYGPETITIQTLYAGNYRFAVHRFDGNGSLAGSGAHVQVYDSTGLIGDFYAPASGSGDWWHVFDINGSTGALTIFDIIRVSSPAPY
jgi:hypothetical protein